MTDSVFETMSTETMVALVEIVEAVEEQADSTSIIGTGLADIHVTLNRATLVLL